jgi:hypothetical protein
MTENGGAPSYGAGKKLEGRKKQALMDTDGRALVLEPQPTAAHAALIVCRTARAATPASHALRWIKDEGGLVCSNTMPVPAVPKPGSCNTRERPGGDRDGLPASLQLIRVPQSASHDRS